MKQWVFIRLGQLIILSAILGVTGCATTSEPGVNGSMRVAKERGVYTTLAVPGQNIDMPASGYASCDMFGPGQTPAAVILGSGTPDTPDTQEGNYTEAYKLQLIEIASGAVIQNLSGQVASSKVDIFNLPIRKSGKYRLKLIINGSVYDTWDFAVNRNDSAANSSATGQAPAYAKGNFGVSLEPVQSTDAFNQYDDTLMLALNDAIERELSHMANQDDFAQIPAGQVVIQFDLNATGKIAAPKIIGNTLSEAIGQFFLRALQDGAPYKAWPAEAHSAIGTDTRTVKATFYYD